MQKLIPSCKTTSPSGVYHDILKYFLFTIALANSYNEKTKNRLPGKGTKTLFEIFYNGAISYLKKKNETVLKVVKSDDGKQIRIQYQHGSMKFPNVILTVTEAENTEEPAAPAPITNQLALLDELNTASTSINRISQAVADGIPGANYSYLLEKVKGHTNLAKHVEGQMKGQKRNKK